MRGKLSISEMLIAACAAALVGVAGAVASADACLFDDDCADFAVGADRSARVEGE